MLTSYLKTDRILSCLQSSEQQDDDAFASHRWLRDFPAKRMIFDHLYPELFSTQRKTLLDIAGGYSALTRKLARTHDYTVVETSDHDHVEMLHKKANEGGFVFANQDWNDFEPKTYDVIIANDIFPNSDQRLDLFLEKYLPCCKILRVSITCYNVPRFYHVQRVGMRETLCIQAWDGVQTRRVLRKYEAYIEDPKLDILEYIGDSIFDNKRQVFSVIMRGGLPLGA